MSDDVLAVQVEKLKREIDRSQKQTALLLQITQIAAASGDADDFITRVTETIVTAQNWVLGQYWSITEDEEIVYCTQLFFSTAHLPEFRTASLESRFSKGVGLPGRVVSNAFPLVIPELETEIGMQFPRKPYALKAGLKSGFAFPIKNGPFTKGVIEFFDIQKIVLDQTDLLFYEKLGLYIASVIAQKESEFAARRSEAVGKIVLEKAYDAFISINESNLIIVWSSGAVDLFGWQPEEVLGKPLIEIVIPERYRDAHVKGLFKYMTTKVGPVFGKRVQAPAMHKDGHEIKVELMIFPIETMNERRYGAYILDSSKVGQPPDIVLE